MTESVYASKGLEDYSRMKRYADYLDYDKQTLFREKGKAEAGLRNIGNSNKLSMQLATSTSFCNCSSTSTTSGKRSSPHRPSQSTLLLIQLGQIGPGAVRRDGDRQAGLRRPHRSLLAPQDCKSRRFRGGCPERFPLNFHSADR